MTEPALSTKKPASSSIMRAAEERWPLSPALRPVREIIEKLDPKPEPQPLPERVQRLRSIPAKLDPREKPESTGSVMPCIWEADRRPDGAGC